MAIRILSSESISGEVLIASGKYLSWGTAGSASIEGSTVSNKLQFRTNSTNAMIIDSSQNVGIGLSAPTDGNLHIKKTGVNTGITNVLMNANFADASNGSGLSIGYRTDETTAVLAARTATGNIAFYSYNGGWSESMRITNTGNVSFNSGLLGLGNASSTPNIGYGMFHYSGVGLGIYSSAGGAAQGIGFWLNNGTAAYEAGRWLSNGNLGIGTASPSEILQTNKNSAGNIVGGYFTNSQANTGAESVSLAFGLNRSGGDFVRQVKAITFGAEQQWTGTPSTVDGYLAFSTISDETVSEKMRINSSGNVGISGDGIQIDRPDVGGGKPYVFWKSGGTTQASIYGASSGAGLRIFLSGGTAAFDNSISFTGIVQQNAQSVVLSNSAYANAAAVQAYATNTANVYPGYGFHKASQLGGFLYATSRTELRYRGDGGTDKVLLMADSDYEEGTWTPSITAASGNSATATYYNPVYTKVGRIVNVVVYIHTINIAAITSGTYIQITGFPFTAENYGDFTASYHSGGWSGGVIVGGYVQDGGNYAYLVRADGQEAQQTSTDLVMTRFMLNVTYQIT